MKTIIAIVLMAAATGCCSISSEDRAKLDKCAQLVDSIQLNGSRLYVTNGVLCVEVPIQNTIEQ